MLAFRRIFRHPGAPAMTSAAFVGRLPMAMFGLAVTLLVVGQTGSYGKAGAVGAAITLCASAGGPIGARLADRHGQHRVLPPLVLTSSAAMTVLTLAVLAGTPTWTWLVVAGLAGLTTPNLGAMIRSRWAHVADDPAELGTAFAMESTLDEVAFVVGPPAATALAVSIAPWSAVAAGVLLSTSGTLALAGQRRTQPPAVRAARVAGQSFLRSGTLWVLTLLLVLMGGVFASLEVSTVAFARERGIGGWTGVLLALFALGSALTAVVLGLQPTRWRLVPRLVAGAAVLAASTAVLPFLHAAHTYAVGMTVSGLGVSAVLISSLQLIERALPRERLTEALALAIAGINVGVAGSVALSGVLIDRGGSSHGLAVGSGAALLGIALVLAAGPHLRRVEAASAPDPVRAHPIEVVEGTLPHGPLPGA